jgi:segregation and condensation protein A
MDAQKLLETITHLIEQAEKGEIDPWDVQVIEVIDRYLELMSPQTTARGYETDLSQSGQAFLSASMLVLFKANTLMQLSTVDNIIDNVSDDAMLDIADSELYNVQRLQLERQLRRRPAAMPPPKRRVTLQELIEQLQIMANQLKRVEKTSKPIRPKRQPSMKTMREALELAHQENLTEVASELEQVLHLSARELNVQEQCWNLEQLVKLWTQTKQAVKKSANANDSDDESENGDMVSVFWALLLLSAQSKVELYQEEFYQEITIRLPSSANRATP